MNTGPADDRPHVDVQNTAASIIHKLSSIEKYIMDHYEPFVACLRLFIAYNEPCRLNQAVLFNPIRTLLCNYKLAPFTTYDVRFDFQVHQCFATLTITNKTHSFYTAQQVYIRVSVI